MVWPRMLSGVANAKVRLMSWFFQDVGFGELSLDLSQVTNPAIGTHHYLGLPVLLTDEARLFRFTSLTKILALRILLEKLRSFF